MDDVKEQEETLDANEVADDGGFSPDAPPAEPAASAAVESDLAAELERLRVEAAANLDGWQRARADFANYKKRVEAERNQLVFLTGVKIIEKMLPVIDDFDRAIAGVPDDLKDNGWIKGVVMTRHKLIGLLESEGVSPIDVQPGDSFDPTIHEAILQEDSELFSAGQVVAALQKGYRIGDRVIRPALVRVAR